MPIGTANTANDGWLAHHRITMDLLLYSQSQVEERCHWLSHVIARAYREGRVLHGQP